jgi:hypothetical protein
MLFDPQRKLLAQAAPASSSHRPAWRVCPCARQRLRTGESIAILHKSMAFWHFDV